MAITEPHYRILRELLGREVFTTGGSLLEIGKANFYGDMALRELLDDADTIKDEQQRAAFVDVLRHPQSGAEYLFKVARLVYAVTIQPSKIDSIDLDPAATDAMRFDLNRHVDLKQQYDMVVNHGTLEHIFDIAQAFRTIHEATKVGGLMIHESPFTGWIDHGFYNLQPTLFWDLAAINLYAMVGVWVEHVATKMHVEVRSREEILHLAAHDAVPDNSMLFVVMKKTSPRSFNVPQQGIYAKSVSAEAAKAWRELR